MNNTLANFRVRYSTLKPPISPLGIIYSTKSLEGEVIRNGVGAQWRGAFIGGFTVDPFWKRHRKTSNKLLGGYLFNPPLEGGGIRGRLIGGSTVDSKHTNPKLTDHLRGVRYKNSTKELKISKKRAKIRICQERSSERQWRLPECCRKAPLRRRRPYCFVRFSARFGTPSRAPSERKFNF